MSGPWEIIRLVCFGAVLWLAGGRLPLGSVARRIADTSRNSIKVVSDRSISDSEKEITARRNSLRILVDTLKLAGLLVVLLALAWGFWYVLNIPVSDITSLFDVFYTLEGLAWPIAGALLAVAGSSIIRRVRV